MGGGKKRKVRNFNEEEMRKVRENEVWVFIHNIPPKSAGKWIQDLFAESGKVWRVQTPSRPNARGRWFAFIQFQHKAEAKEAINMFNGFYWKGYKLFVTMAWKKGNLQQSERRKVEMVWKKVGSGSSKDMPCSDEAILAWEHEKCRGSEVVALREELGRSHLAVAHSNLSADALKREIAGQGVYEISIRGIGSRVFVIHCPDQSFDGEMIKEDWNWLKNWVTVVPNKQMFCSKGGRFMWVAIFGIPFQGWCEETFDACASELGTPIFIHPHSVEGSNMEVSYVLIHSMSLLQVSKDVLIQIGQDFFKVLVKPIEGHLVPVFSAQHESSLLSNSFKSRHNFGKEGDDDDLCVNSDSVESTKGVGDEADPVCVDSSLGVGVDGNPIVGSDPLEIQMEEGQRSVGSGNSQESLKSGQELVAETAALITGVGESERFDDQEVEEAANQVPLIINNGTGFAFDSLDQRVDVGVSGDEVEDGALGEKKRSELENLERDFGLDEAGISNAGIIGKVIETEPVVKGMEFIGGGGQGHQKDDRNLLIIDEENHRGSDFINACAVIEKTQIDEVVEMLGFNASSFKCGGKKFSKKKVKAKQKRSPYGYETRSKKRVERDSSQAIDARCGLSKSQLEARKTWDFCKSIGLKSYGDEDLVIAQFEKLEEDLNLSVNLDVGPED